MRCMACGAEMRVVEVVPDETTMVPGYERHTLQCTGCNDTERRLVFSREKTPVESVPPPTQAEAPQSAPQTERAPAQSAWARALAMFRGRQLDKGS